MANREVSLNPTTTSVRAAFSLSGKPILDLRQVGSTARDRLRLMRKHNSLSERLDFALSVVRHFCLMQHWFLGKDILLADRHAANIGFNKPLQGHLLLTPNYCQTRYTPCSFALN